MSGKPPVLPDTSHFLYPISREYFPDQSIDHDYYERWLEKKNNNSSTTTTTTTTTTTNNSHFNNYNNYNHNNYNQNNYNHNNSNLNNYDHYNNTNNKKQFNNQNNYNQNNYNQNKQRQQEQYSPKQLHQQQQNNQQPQQKNNGETLLAVKPDPEVIHIDKNSMDFLIGLLPDIEVDTLECMLIEYKGDVEKVVQLILGIDVGGAGGDIYTGEQEHYLSDPSKLEKLSLEETISTTTTTTAPMTASAKKRLKKKEKEKQKQLLAAEQKQQSVQTHEMFDPYEMAMDSEKQDLPNMLPINQPSSTTSSTEEDEEQKRISETAKNQASYKEMMGTLQDMFGHYSRQDLALVLDINGFDLNSTIEALLDETTAMMLIEAHKAEVQAKQQAKQQQQQQTSQQSAQRQPQQQQQTAQTQQKINNQTKNNNKPILNQKNNTKHTQPQQHQPQKKFEDIMKEQNEKSLAEASTPYKYVQNSKSTKQQLHQQHQQEQPEEDQEEHDDTQEDFGEVHADDILELAKMRKKSKADDKKLNILLKEYSSVLDTDLIRSTYSQTNNNFQASWRALSEMSKQELGGAQVKNLAIKIKQQQQQQQQKQQHINKNNSPVDYRHAVGASSVAKINEDDRVNIIHSPPNKVEIYSGEKNEADKNFHKVHIAPKRVHSPKISATEANQKDYTNYRAEANRYSALRNAFFQQAAAAYMSGKAAEARSLSEQGHFYDRKVKECNQNASNQIFLSCNSRINDTLKIDLHGLHVAEALEMVSQILDVHMNGEYQGDGDKPKKIEFICGMGNHSQGGVARIKPALISLLRESNIKFQDLGGLIMVHLKDR